MIHLPIELDTAAFEIERDIEAPATEIIQYETGHRQVPIPVFCVDKNPFDVKRVLINSIKCPVRYLSEAPPTLVTENFCFMINGDIVDIDDILRESRSWWRDTSKATRYYMTDCMKAFHQVTMLATKGTLRSAYKAKSKGGGMERIPLDKVYRVMRHFSFWRSCPKYHRILSLVQPVTEEGEGIVGFKKRIFIQYLWRTNSNADKERVALEYASESAASNFSVSTRRPPRLSRIRSIDIQPEVPSFIGKM
uniref:Uncharacterized protein n=1 Tax=Panagrellus redivivus TaxID=6233 RepID=A0A7E4VY81_PANRE